MDLVNYDLLIQAGVDISKLERMTRLGLNIVWKTYTRHKSRTVVSSTYEGDHIAGSLHYCHQAFDTEPPSTDTSQIFAECKDALGPDWYIQTKPAYWHYEYDPKDAKRRAP